jgi:hypothetical protein
MIQYRYYSSPSESCAAISLSFQVKEAFALRADHVDLSNYEEFRDPRALYAACWTKLALTPRERSGEEKVLLYVYLYAYVLCIPIRIRIPVLYTYTYTYTQTYTYAYTFSYTYTYTYTYIPIPRPIYLYLPLCLYPYL